MKTSRWPLRRHRIRRSNIQPCSTCLACAQPSHNASSVRGIQRGPLNHLQTLPLSPQQMETSIAASPRPGITTDILERIAAHLKPDDARPIADIILDRFRVQGEGGFSADEYFEHVSISIVGNVGDALEAAGYRTILTNDSPWEGGKSDLTHILTPGGNEDTEEEVGMGRFTGLTLKTSVPSL